MIAKKVSLRSHKAMVGLLLISPAVLLLMVFRYYPIGSALYHSFFNWNGFTSGSFVGLANFARLARDRDMLASVGNLGWFVAGRLVLNLSFPLMGAMMIFHLHNHRAAYAYRVAFMVPMVVPLLVVLLTWKFVYHPHDGILNQVLRGIGLPKLAQPWLGGFQTSLWSVIGIGFPWVTGLGISGFAMLIYLAGLQNISPDIFDALRVDGTPAWLRIWRFEVPLIVNQLKTVGILTVINTLQAYVPVMILTNGGPSNSSLVPALHLYRNAFDYNRFGYASAIGVVMSIILVIFTLLTNRFVRSGADQ